MSKLYKIIFLLLISFSACHTFVYAQNMKDLMQKAQKLSYKGQIQHAEDLLGKKSTKSDSKSSSGSGWDMNSMLLTLFWSSIGSGYFLFGRKQGRFVFLICGIGLAVLPMFLNTNMWTTIMYIVMIILPFKI